MNIKPNLLYYLVFIYALVWSQAYAQSGAANASDDILNIINGKKSAPIVLLGEQKHGTKEHYATAFGVIKSLVDSQDYRLLLSESKFIDSFIAFRKGKDFPLSTIGPMYHLAQEFGILKRIDQPFKHVGFDCQVNTDFEKDEFLADYFNLEGDQRTTFEDGLQRLSEITPGDEAFTLLLQQLSRKSNDALDRQLLRNLAICSEIRAIEAVHAKNWKPAYGNLRDKMMAENALFWYDYFGKQKFIALAASAHLAYNFEHLEHDDLQQYIPMGAYLNGWQGKEISQPLLNIAFTSAQGWTRAATTYQTEQLHVSAGTIEAAVLDSGKPYEVHQLQDKGSFSAKAIDGAVISGKYGTVWDLLVVFTEATGLDRYKGDDQEKDYLEIGKETIALQVVNAETGEAVPYALITVSGLQEGTNTNEKGQFILLNKPQYQDKNIRLSSLGYETQYIPFSSLKPGVSLQLKPNIELLGEVVIEAKAINPEGILIQAIRGLQKVNQKRHLHYYQINSEVAFQGDTLKISTVNELSIVDAKTFSINIIGIKPYDKKLFNALGANASHPWRGLLNDHYSFLPVMKEKNLKQFVLEVDSIEQLVDGYVISFKAKNHARRLVNHTGIISYYGKIWVSSKENQIDKTEVIYEAKNGNRYTTETYYELVDQEIIPVLVKEKSIMSGQHITHHVSWLESVPYSEPNKKMDYDLVTIKPSKKAFDRFNQFVK